MEREATLGKLLSINAGMPKTVPHGRKEVETGIHKTPLDGPVRLSFGGIPGDGQADLVNHGGPDKAVCVYTAEHRPYWAGVAERLTEAAAFGENFTISGGLETDVCIGDRMRVGEAIVEVAQPRIPCFKLALRHGLAQLPQLVQETGYTGYYFRVLQEGRVEAGNELTLEYRHPHKLTVFEAARTMLFGKHDIAAIERLLAVDTLAAGWRETLAERLLALREGKGG